MHCIRSLLLAVLTCLVWTLCLPVAAGAQEPGIQLHMEVGELGQQRESFGVGELHTWYIHCTFPKEVPDWEYSLIQTLSPALSLQENSIALQVRQANGESVFLEMGTDYTLTSGSVFVEGGTADRFSLTLTETGTIGLKAGGELLLTYHACINQNAYPGTQILGSAQLNCMDRSAHRTIYISDKACVYTGGFPIVLTDHNNHPIHNGKFMLAREASQQELTDPLVLTELLDIGEETIVAVYETFYSGKTLSSVKTDVAITDESGGAFLWGLPFGTYYLVQIEEPGHLVSVPPVQVRVDEISHLTGEDGWYDSHGKLTDQTIRIVSSGILLPKTGGPGIRGYQMTGSFVILSACLLLWLNRRREYVV